MKAIVIGGSGTIGRAITHDLLSNGYEVIVTYHHTPLATLMDEFQGQPVQFVQLDLSQPV
ncbi:SDR family NAD(P)-dependent oxidoreductase, partial [Staphylococcus pseudintermedius]|nr:SDR family NAD(P)-dependent oxidoreductase [Staphylococcus pseudintermedius]EIE3867576.1 SDR family NAD(P)-dependent oxidoreductase [Staphylococcus pseudintermedius]